MAFGMSSREWITAMKAEDLRYSVQWRNAYTEETGVEVRGLTWEQAKVKLQEMRARFPEDGWFASPEQDTL
jgi:hypothetical protein